VRPALPTASIGPSQAPTAAVDNAAPLATRPQSTYKSGNAVQTSGATSLDDVEIAYLHENLNLPLRLNAGIDPTFEPRVVPLRPASKGAIVFLDGYAHTNAADAWITAFLVRGNKLQPDLCLICVPLPGKLHTEDTRAE
jgi:hypothetical protein